MNKYYKVTATHTMVFEQIVQAKDEEAAKNAIWCDEDSIKPNLSSVDYEIRTPMEFEIKQYEEG